MSSTIRRIAIAITSTIAVTGFLGIALAGGQLSPNDTACLSNLKQVSTALLMYCQDYDEQLPPMKSAAMAQNCIYPYVKNKSIFTCPATGKQYKANAAVGGKGLTVIAEPPKAVTFYDALPHADGQYTVAYVDGHVKREAKAPSLAVKFKPQKTGGRMKKH